MAGLHGHETGIAVDHGSQHVGKQSCTVADIEIGGERAKKVTHLGTS
jgi:hypothetical protein